MITLLLVLMAAGYYYLIYIPARENEIIERRFRMLQRIELNMKEKFNAYVATIRNCLSQSNDPAFLSIIKKYNSDPDRFIIRLVKRDTIRRTAALRVKGELSEYDSAKSLLSDSVSSSVKYVPTNNLRNIIFQGNSFKLLTNSTIKHVLIEGSIDYKAFVSPLLRKNIFDQYIVFNVKGDSSTVVYESFPSGISFNNIDSLFDAREKVYSSRVVHIETGGRKYLAFLHPCGYNHKNDRIVLGLYSEDAFNAEKQRMPEKMVMSLLFIALFTFLLLPFLRLLLLGKKDRD